MILASSSPQRQRLIIYIDSEIESLTADVDETFNDDISVYDNVMEVAKKKALAVIDKHNVDNEVVIGCDTIVVQGKEVLLKPINYDDAYRMIKSYDNNDTEIVSGVCVAYVKDGKTHTETFVETSWVRFKNITEEGIKNWLAEDDYLGCSGAIKIEKVQKYFDVEIEGSISNIIGLPLEKLTTFYIAHMEHEKYPTLYEDLIETPITRTRSTSRVIPFDGEFVYFVNMKDKTDDIGYTLIGGGCTLFEDIMEAGKREVIEETGFIVADLEPLGVSYIYHERPDEFLGYDKFWVHQFMSFARIVEVKEHHRLDYEVDMISSIDKMTIDEAIIVFKEQNEKYKNHSNKFFYWFNSGVVEALELMKEKIEK